MQLRPHSCERATEFVSRSLDGELSLIERAILNRHLERCDSCAAYADRVSYFTALVRAAPLEPARVPMDVWRRRRLPVSRVVQSFAAAAAVVAVGIWLGVAASQPQQQPAPSPKIKPIRASIVNDRLNWPAGLPRAPESSQLFPGGLYTASVA